MVSYKLPILGVDIDNVISVTDSKIRDLIKIYFGLDVTQGQITHWNYHKSIPISQEDELFLLDNFHKNHINSLDILPGAVESLTRLSRDFVVWLVTARPISTKETTISWLYNHCIPYNQLFFSKTKLEVYSKCNVVIEDNGDIAIALSLKEIPVLLFEYPWNRHISSNLNIYRVNGWKEALEILKQFELILSKNPNGEQLGVNIKRTESPH